MNLKDTPFLKIRVMEPDIEQTQLGDGAIHLKSTVSLLSRPHRMTDRLLHWAKETPDKVFIGQKNEQGQWDTLTYRETLEKVESLAKFLLDSKVDVDHPLAILSGNSIEHGLMALAALHLGLPYSAIAPPYSLRSTDYAKLHHTIQLLTPGLLFVQNGQQYAKAVSAVAPQIEVVAVEDVLPGQLVFEEIIQGPSGNTDGVREAFERIQADTLAKILFTSGSTGLPKGVMSTHANITTNWQQITQIFPFMQNGGLTFLDWLPWNHVFGGTHNFGLTLFNGGSLYIDEGKPTASGIQQTVHNLHEIAPTMYCNVPKGFEELIPFLQRDQELRTHFFSQLKLLFYAGAGMPQHVWDALEELAYITTGKRILISTGLGMTEANPSCMFNVQFGSFPRMLGTPVAGLDMKLVPNEGKLEARFRGANITKGYWRNPTATAKAFDEDGYYCTGDALKFVNPDDPNEGMIFDGRIAEDFKLDTGTWVNVGVLKAKLIAAGGGLIKDAVITGHNEAFVGAIVFPDPAFCQNLVGEEGKEILGQPLSQSEPVQEALQGVLDKLAGSSTGSSTLIKRAIIADFDLSLDKGEITDKGSVNQRKVLENHAEVVERLYRKHQVSCVLQVSSKIIA